MKNMAVAYSVKRRAKMANGGEVMNEKLHPSHEPKSAMDMVSAIMEKRRMAKGGMVDDDAFLTEEMPAEELGDDTYPDLDEKEVDPLDKKKARLKAILGR